MSASQIQALPVIYFQSLTAKILQSFSDKVLASITFQQAALISKEALSTLDEDKRQILLSKKDEGRILLDVQHLTPLELMNASLDKMESSSKENIQAIAPENIPFMPFISEVILKLTPTQISNVQNYQWRQIPQEILSQLTLEQKEARRANEIIHNVVYFDLSSKEKIKQLHPAMVEKIMPSRLATIPPQLIEGFRCAHINVFSNEQLQALSQEQLRFINALALSMDQLDFLLEKIRKEKQSSS